MIPRARLPYVFHELVLFFFFFLFFILQEGNSEVWTLLKFMQVVPISWLQHSLELFILLQFFVLPFIDEVHVFDELVSLGVLY